VKESISDKWCEKRGIEKIKGTFTSIGSALPNPLELKKRGVRPSDRGKNTSRSSSTREIDRPNERPADRSTVDDMVHRWGEDFFCFLYVKEGIGVETSKGYICGVARQSKETSRNPTPAPSATGQPSWASPNSRSLPWKRSGLSSSVVAQKAQLFCLSLFKLARWD
jgi:hypothetical protein